MEDLPDGPLVLILSKLSLVEAVKTSLVSQRFRNLWRQCTCLDFDATTMLPEEEVDYSEAWYVEWVDIVTSRWAGAEFSVQDFRIHYCLERSYIDRLRIWMIFAAEKHAEAVHLNLGRYFPPMYFDIWHECSLSADYCSDALSELENNAGLKTLVLTYVNLTKQRTESILERCRVIEELSIMYAGNVADLNVSSPRLRRLIISGSEPNILTQINAPELVYLYIEAQVFQPHAVRLPKLVQLSIDVSEPLQILNVLKPFGTQLEVLQHLCCGLLEEEDGIVHIPKFLSLNSLAVYFHSISDSCCRRFISLLNACPSLEKLWLHFPTIYPAAEDPSKLILQEGAKCQSLRYLKQMELVVFEKEVFGWGFVMDVIENSLHLEMLVINIAMLNELTLGSEGGLEYLHDVIRCAIKLRSKLPIGAKLIFVEKRVIFH